jgi:hypothetical protein
MAKTATKTAKAPKDTSPTWNGCEEWSADQFMSNFRRAMEFYRLEHSGRELKPAIIKWMGSNEYSKDDIAEFKKTKDTRCTVTMGGLASCLNRGMTAQRADFNDGKDSAKWLRDAIAKVVAEGTHDVEEVEGEVVAASPMVNIQERVREASFNMTDEIEDALESFHTDPDNFDPKAFKVLNLLKGKDAKAAHARIIKTFYEKQLEELVEATSVGADEQLKEAYSHRNKNQWKKLIAFLTEVSNACTMLMEESKVNRKPRAKKAQPKDKVVAKMKFMKTFEALKLVSINPTDIIGAKELWVYNTKTRKLGKYVAAAYQELGVKGTTVTNFNETESICKTLRKPEDKLKEFKTAGKVALRKFLEDINATDTKMNGRINEEVILLKVQ